MALADAELRYVAPELFTGRTADVRSDVFTLGVLIYEMATGRSALRRRHAAGAAGQDAARARRATRASCSRTLPAPAAAAIQTALSSAPEKRFAGAREFLAAFQGGADRRKPSDW